jgi:hypothetical protein
LQQETVRRKENTKNKINHPKEERERNKRNHPKKEAVGSFDQMEECQSIILK